ncbi:MAG TPA: C4-type zinc ribbon domain-containing protein [Candidatus Margulisiibacteriota bacterium]|nr:C4-type zinc ribbon domain-containing protein [Candidatus Margulisiibacteriota bacterium]
MEIPTETPIDKLAALQELDRQLREKTELVRASEGEVTELENQLAQQREVARQAREARDAANARRIELETHLDAEEAKMKDRRMRLNRVRNEKELQALRREIEVSKEANQQTEEEVLRVLETVETLTAAAAEADQRLGELEATAATTINERRTGLGQLLEDVAREREIRDRMANALDASLRQKYEQIFARRGGTAVVEVRNGTCQGCHMNLPPQLFNELQRTREVRTCPNCHRILFWRAERLEDAESSR